MDILAQSYIPARIDSVADITRKSTRTNHLYKKYATHSAKIIIERFMRHFFLSRDAHVQRIRIVQYVQCRVPVSVFDVRGYSIMRRVYCDQKNEFNVSHTPVPVASHPYCKSCLPHTVAQQVPAHSVCGGKRINERTQ